MELNNKQKKIAAVAIVATVSILIIVAASSDGGQIQQKSFIVTDNNKVDLSGYSPKIKIDEGGRVRVNEQSDFTAGGDSDLSGWTDFVESNDVEEIPELTVYVQDEHGNKQLVDRPMKSQKNQSRTTATIPENEEKINYYVPKGTRIKYDQDGKAYLDEPKEQRKAKTESTPVPSADVSEKEQRRMSIESRYGKAIADFVVPCVVHSTQEIKPGQTLRLRVTKDAIIGGVKIPRNTILYAVVSFNGHRADIRIASLKIENNYYNLTLVGLGEDGQNGLILNSNELDKEIGNSVTQEVVSQAAAVASQLGVVGQIAGTVGRAAVGARRQSTDRSVRFLDGQKVNLVPIEN